MMTSRRWENIAKYFFDLSKLVMAIAVISQLVLIEIKPNVIVFGALAGIVLFAVGYFSDVKGD